MLEAKSVHLCIGASRLEFLQNCQASRVSGDLPQGERTWLASIWVFLPNFAEKNLGHKNSSVLDKAVFLGICRYHIFYLLKAALNVIGKEALQTCRFWLQFTVGWFALPIPAKNSWKTLGGSRSARNVRLSEKIRANQATSLSSKCPEFTKAFLGSHHTWEDLEWVSFCLRSSDRFTSFLLHRLPCLLLSYIRSRLCGLRQSKDFRHSQPTNWCRLLAGAVFRNSFCFNINILWISQQLIDFDCFDIYLGTQIARWASGSTMPGMVRGAFF